jgi:two-component system NtrC family sensor kinase
MGQRTIKRGMPAKRIRALKPDTRKTRFSAMSLRRQLEQHARELDEAREQQAATSEILNVIRRSPADAQPVFDAIVESAARLCGAIFSVAYLWEGGRPRVVATRNFTAEATSQMYERQELRGLTRSHAGGRAIMDRTIVHIPDVLADAEYSREYALAGGWRAVLAIPLLHDGEPVGAISVAKRDPTAFSNRQVQLLNTFADQALIAIENVRLFEAEKLRTRELSEALEQQTATSEVLQVISSSQGELESVFQATLANATRLCQASYGVIWLSEGDAFRSTATYGSLPAAYVERWRSGTLYHPHPYGGLATMRRTRKSVQFEDLRVARSYAEGDVLAVTGVELGGIRTVIVVPMFKEDELVGGIAIYRQEVRPFTEKQVELVAGFAKQAVIAIENTRLLNELRQSLQQQTATADVLKVISRSTVELDTVLDTLVETLTRLCRVDNTTMYRRRDDDFYLVASRGLSEEAKALARTYPVASNRGSLIGRVAMERRPVQIPDVLQDPEYTHQELQKILKYRSTLGIPLLRGDALIGIFALNRARAEPFTEKEIELASTFADQAVIAIENARLFEELRERQAELRVTFENMGDGVAMFDAATQLTAWNRNFQKMLELPEDFLSRRPSFVEVFRYLAERGEYSADLEAQLSRTLDDPSQELRFERTRPDGRVIEVRRNPVPGGGLVLIYADVTRRKQAEEAIRAARDAAETALRDLQMAQTSLVHAQKMAALGQLTAGIAHEIKNPLNFVNNFSELSVELADELNGVLKQASLAEKFRKEADELTALLKDNLGKVVVHGKRADSIVKNMLLHSREDTGERRAVDINALVDESLNLAYHGARAERQGFKIKLEREFDPTAGTAEIYPQEMTRVFLNLLSNGFYAANKRAAEGGSQPRLKAATRNLGERVEIRFRDNGTGIPLDVFEKIFNPFFTTKPAGEGTGLGLSVSHEIVVKQHGGSIDVDTELGAFTEFIVTLPRARLAH